MKSLLNKEREYSSPVYDRLYKNKPIKNKDIENIVARANERERVATTTRNTNIKYTTDLSNSIEIHKRFGIEHLLPQKDFNKAAALKKKEEEKKARKEFEEMVKEHNKQRRTETLTKSKTVNKPQSLNKSVMSTHTARSTAKPGVQTNKAGIQASNQSNKYLYKRLCSELDEHVSDLREEEPEVELLNKDHIRIVLVKTGFIGNDINNMAEIQNDEAMLEEIWRILRGPENSRVSPHNLKTLCGIIQGLIAPAANKFETEEENKDISKVVEEESDSTTFGSFNNAGNFTLKNRQEKTKIIKMFGRLAQNRNKFLRDRIKEKQNEKIKQTETFIPTINKNSALMEQRRIDTQGGRVPRYEILLEMGRKYNLDREQKQQIYEAEGNSSLNPEDALEEVQNVGASNMEQQRALKQAIHDIKTGKYVHEEVEFHQEYQTPDMDEEIEYERERHVYTQR